MAGKPEGEHARNIVNETYVNEFAALQAAANRCTEHGDPEQAGYLQAAANDYFAAILDRCRAGEKAA